MKTNLIVVWLLLASQGFVSGKAAAKTINVAYPS
jgi:hypothetical protein